MQYRMRENTSTGGESAYRTPTRHRLRYFRYFYFFYFFVPKNSFLKYFPKITMYLIARFFIYFFIRIIHILSCFVFLVCRAFLTLSLWLGRLCKPQATSLATSCRWIPKKLPIKVSKSCQKVAIFFKKLPKSCQNFSAFRTFFGC